MPSGDIHGEFNAKLATTALARLAASADPQLQQIQVQGRLVSVSARTNRGSRCFYSSTSYSQIATIQQLSCLPLNDEGFTSPLPRSFFRLSLLHPFTLFHLPSLPPSLYHHLFLRPSFLCPFLLPPPPPSSSFPCPSSSQDPAPPTHQPTPLL